MDAIKVGIRVRPLLKRELEKGSQWIATNNSIVQTVSSNPYYFDYVFNTDSSTDSIYDVLVKPIVASVMEGFNGTIFAYGQTSSGKTHTMMGSSTDYGIIPLAISDILQCIGRHPEREFIIRASYLEIYNESLTDLLDHENKNLRIREDTEHNVSVLGITERTVQTPQEIGMLLQYGQQYRSVGETQLNERSSRSHTIFTLNIESRPCQTDEEQEGSEDGIVKVAALNLVDLAGSERASTAGTEGVRFKEGTFINLSLLELGNVISKLSEGKSSHIPFRNSKLTRILQSSLGGNAKTCIICTITPAEVGESHSTLKFASRAMKITNKPKVNEVLVGEEALMKRLRAMERENQKLKERLEEGLPKNEQQELTEQLAETEREKECLKKRLTALEKIVMSTGSHSKTQSDKTNRRKTVCCSDVFTHNSPALSRKQRKVTFACPSSPPPAFSPFKPNLSFEDPLQELQKCISPGHYTQLKTPVLRGRMSFIPTAISTPFYDSLDSQGEALETSTDISSSSVLPTVSHLTQLQPIPVDTQTIFSKPTVTMDTQTDSAEPTVSVDTQTNSAEPIVSVDTQTNSPEYTVSVDTQTDSTESTVSVDTQTNSPEYTVSVDTQTDSTEPTVSVDTQTDSTEPTVSVDTQTNSPECTVSVDTQTDSTESTVSVDTQTDSTEPTVSVDTQTDSLECTVSVDTQTDSAERTASVDTQTNSPDCTVSVDTQTDSAEPTVSMDVQTKSSEPQTDDLRVPKKCVNLDDSLCVHRKLAAEKISVMEFEANEVHVLMEELQSRLTAAERALVDAKADHEAREALLQTKLHNMEIAHEAQEELLIELQNRLKEASTKIYKYEEMNKKLQQEKAELDEAKAQEMSLLRSDLAHANDEIEARATELETVKQKLAYLQEQAALPCGARKGVVVEMEEALPLESNTLCLADELEALHQPTAVSLADELEALHQPTAVSLADELEALHQPTAVSLADELEALHQPTVVSHATKMEEFRKNLERLSAELALSKSQHEEATQKLLRSQEENEVVHQEVAGLRVQLVTLHHTLQKGTPSRSNQLAVENKRLSAKVTELEEQRDRDLEKFKFEAEKVESARKEVEGLRKEFSELLSERNGLREKNETVLVHLSQLQDDLRAEQQKGEELLGIKEEIEALKREVQEAKEAKKIALVSQSEELTLGFREQLSKVEGELDTLRKERDKLQDEVTRAEWEEHQSDLKVSKLEGELKDLQDVHQKMVSQLPQQNASTDETVIHLRQQLKVAEDELMRAEQQKGEELLGIKEEIEALKREVQEAEEAKKMALVSQSEELTLGFREQLSKVEGELDTLRKERDKLQDEVTRADWEEHQSDLKVSKLEGELKDLQEVHQKMVSQLSQQNASTDETVIHLRQQLKTLKMELVSENSASAELTLKLKEQLATTEGELAASRKECEQLHSHVLKVQDEQQQKGEELLGIKEEIEALKREVQEAEEAKKMALVSQSEELTLGFREQLSKVEGELDTLRKERDKLQDEVMRAEWEEHQSDLKVSKLEGELKDLQDVHQKMVSQLSQQNASTDETVIHLRQQLKALKMELVSENSASAELTLKLKEQLATAEGKLAVSRKECEQLHSRFRDELKESEEKAEKLEQKLKQTEVALEELKEEYTRLETSCNKIQDDLLCAEWHERENEERADKLEEELRQLSAKHESVVAQHLSVKESQRRITELEKMNLDLVSQHSRDQDELTKARQLGTKLQGDMENNVKFHQATGLLAENRELKEMITAVRKDNASLKEKIQKENIGPKVCGGPVVDGSGVVTGINFYKLQREFTQVTTEKEEYRVKASMVAERLTNAKAEAQREREQFKRLYQERNFFRQRYNSIKQVCTCGAIDKIKSEAVPVSYHTPATQQPASSCSVSRHTPATQQPASSCSVSRHTPATQQPASSCSMSRHTPAETRLPSSQSKPSVLTHKPPSSAMKQSNSRATSSVGQEVSFKVPPSALRKPQPTLSAELSHKNPPVSAMKKQTHTHRETHQWDTTFAELGKKKDMEQNCKTQ